MQEPTSEPSRVDMSTDPTHPPRDFSHQEWCDVRDKLWLLAEPYKSDKEDPRSSLVRVYMTPGDVCNPSVRFRSSASPCL